MSVNDNTHRWTNYRCTCSYFHIIALAVSQNLVEIPIKYIKNLVLAKVKASRKAKPKKCLEKQ